MMERNEYIEKVGLFYEQYGLPKMAGRILGYLISAPNDHNSFDDLIAGLHASKGSISGNIKLLLTQNMIEKYMISGDRKSYFKVSTNSLNRIIEAKVVSITQFKDIIGMGLVFNEHQQTPARDELLSIHRYYEFLEQEIPLLKQKWDLIYQQK